MYLPLEIKKAEVLITVKTYPLPSSKYEELVCTAGFLHDGKWIRIYPIPFRSIPYEKRFSKYQWIKLDLKRNNKDFRPESYRPIGEANNSIELLEHWDTKSRDLYLFVGTTLKYHSMKVLNPFVIIGVFYPPKEKEKEASLFQ